MTQKRSQESRKRPPALEWIASGLGLLITCFILGVIAWEMASGGSDRPPAIEVSAQRVTPVAGGYVVEVVAVNRSPATAADVEIEGRLGDGETSSVALDYVPGGSTRKAGLFFSRDPRAAGLELRALGYTRP